MKTVLKRDELKGGPLTKSYVAVLKPECRDMNLASIPLEVLEWPLGAPPNMSGKTVADMSADDHILRSPKTPAFCFPNIRVKAKVSLVFSEPEALHRQKMRLAHYMSWRFHRILTGNKWLLANQRKARKFIYGDKWVHEWEGLDTTKSKMLSLIASKKNVLTGHKLRHEVASWLSECGLEADIAGGGYRWLEFKSEVLAPHYYSVVIENVREPNYFTEKLIDCFLCRAVPIYWGDPDIKSVFDERGMIVCTSFEEITHAIKSISIADYDARLPFLEANRKIAINYTQPRVAAAKLLLADDKL